MGSFIEFSEHILTGIVQFSTVLMELFGVCVLVFTALKS